MNVFLPYARLGPRVLRGALAVCLVLTLAASAPATLIDSFDNADPAGGGGLAAPGIFLSGPPSSTSTTDTVAGVIGGVRAGDFTLTSGPGAANLTSFVLGSTIAMNLGGNGNGTFMLTYGPGLGANLEDGSGIRIDIPVLDAAAAAGAGTDFILQLDDNDTTHTLTVNKTSSGAQEADFLFKFFSDPGNLDVTNIDQIKLTVIPEMDGDVTIDFVETFSVPEPTSLAIWSLLGMAGAGYRWRKRRRK